MAPLRRRHVLVAFDAFGTIFSPKQTIGIQYAEVAQRHGFCPLDPNIVGQNCKAAIKLLSARHPSFRIKAPDGSLSTMLWWTHVIRETFQPFLHSPTGKTVTAHQMDAVVHELWHRFSSSEGYHLHQDAWALIRHLHRRRRERSSGNQKLFVGVLSNSDDRTRSVLCSLGLITGPLRGNGFCGPEVPSAVSDQHHLQFVSLSQDFGNNIAKPNPAIFHRTEMVVREKLLPDDCKQDDIHKVYIGDDPQQDVISANKAGWHSILVDRNLTVDSLKDNASAAQFINSLVDSKDECLQNIQVSSLWSPS